MERPEKDNAYYFVPLGREPGGYHDLLSMPPNATHAQVRKAEAKYIKNLKKTKIEKKKELKEKLKEQKITQEEFDAEIAVFEEEQTDKLAELNRLKENYDKERSEKRALNNQGIRQEIHTWLNMYELLTDQPDVFQGMINGPAPLPMLGKEDIFRLKTTPPNSNTDDATLTGLRQAVFNTKMVMLFTIDDFWQMLGAPDRLFWKERVDLWIEEIKASRPVRYLSEETEIPHTKPILPLLCSPTPLAIDKLQNEEIEDFTRLPERKDDNQLNNLLEDLFRAMLNRNQDKFKKKSSSDFSNRRERDTAKGADLLDLLAGMLKKTDK